MTTSSPKNGSAQSKPDARTTDPRPKPTTYNANSNSTNIFTSSPDTAKHSAVSSPLAAHKSGRRTTTPSDSGIMPAMKDKHNVDIMDGKTKACDRTRTFDGFVEEERLGAEEIKKEEKRIKKQQRREKLRKCCFVVPDYWEDEECGRQV